MMTEPVGRLLSGLLARHDILEVLAHEPSTKPELVAACGVSRSTVDRGLKELAAVGIVERGALSRYELTLYGETVTREFARATARVEQLAEIRSFFTSLENVDGIESSFFDDATITRSSGMGVLAARRAFDSATELVLIDPPFPLLLAALLPAQSGGGPDRTVVVARIEMLEELSTYEIRPVDAATALDVDLYELHTPLPVPIALVDDSDGRSVCLILSTGHEGVAFVETTAPAALDWCDAFSQQALTDARRVESTMTPDFD